MVYRSDLAQILEMSRLPGSQRLARAVLQDSGIEAAADQFRAPFLPGSPPTIPAVSSFAEGALNAVDLLDSADEPALDALEDRSRWAVVVLWAGRYTWHNPGLGWERTIMSEWDTDNRPVKDGWGVALRELASYQNCPHREWLNEAADEVPGSDQDRLQRVAHVHKTRTVTSRIYDEAPVEVPVEVPHGQYAWDLVAQQMMVRRRNSEWAPTGMSGFDAIAASHADFDEATKLVLFIAGFQLLASCFFLISTGSFGFMSAIVAGVIAVVVGVISRQMLYRYWSAT